MHSITSKNVPNAYKDVMELIHIVGALEESRNGPVITIQEPFTLKITEPTERVLFNPARDANPFFHVMEAIWMLAGRDDVEFLLPYNKRYIDYAEPSGKVWGAYGIRWRYQFALDQIAEAIDLLGENPETRQVVIGMWHPYYDLGAQTKDRPCNTHIYFRSVAGRLNMTLCNRSNDVVWGMLGANAVHMTMLHELVARGCGIPMGDYYVITNNAHVYPEMPRYSEIMSDLWHHDAYGPEVGGVEPYPLLAYNEDWSDFLHDAELFCEGKHSRLKTKWFDGVALPMQRAWESRAQADLDSIEAMDWRLACIDWVNRRNAKK